MSKNLTMQPVPPSELISVQGGWGFLAGLAVGSWVVAGTAYVTRKLMDYEPDTCGAGGDDDDPSSC